MELKQFMDELLASAQAEGFEAAEAYCGTADSFTARMQAGQLTSYSSAESQALSFRGVWHGKMGYASTQAFDENAIHQLIEGAKESAEVNEAPEQDEIFAGEESYPEIEAVETDISDISADEKLTALREIEEAASKADERISTVQACGISTVQSRVMLQNTYGLKLSDESSFWSAHVMLIAERGEKKVNGGHGDAGFCFRKMDRKKLIERAVDETVSKLSGESLPTGEYRVILNPDAESDMLATFSGIFSAQQAQLHLSLLEGKEGQKVASEVVTLIDDPLMKGGYATGAFDGEGSASQTKKVIENGVLKTLLHNRRTAKKQGVKTTGNAVRTGGRITVSPTNFYFKPGEKSLQDMLVDMGSGVLITQVSGLHSGANKSSGDFSLLARGYWIENGRRERALEQITIAGNFYRMLENVRAVGNDLQFVASSIGGQSLDVGTLMISGKKSDE